MTRNERLDYFHAANVMEHKIIGKTFVEIVPTSEQIEAMALAMDAMQCRMNETGIPLNRHIAVLRYHMAHPTAMLFKDGHTMAAMKVGVSSIKWLLAQEEEPEDKA